jgi:cytochrome b involved in lipid metabolism
MCKATEQAVGEGRQYTPAEVAVHNHKGSCWIVVDSAVFDVTTWMARHPGGQEILLMYAGDDATDVFKAFHHPRE